MVILFGNVRTTHDYSARDVVRRVIHDLERVNLISISTPTALTPGGGVPD